MLTIDVENLKPAIDYDGNMTVSFTVCPNSAEMVMAAYESIRDKKLVAEVKVWRAKRSLDANAFLWVLCDKIARQLRSTKEEVYRELVKRVGVFETVPIRADAVESFGRMWAGRGLGWFVEVVDDSKLPGYKKVFIYFGSSSYDTAQMSRLIDEAVQEAEALGIPTLPEGEVRQMKEDWDAKVKAHESTGDSARREGGGMGA